ncbi:DUF1178 family protein [Hydrogenophaga sp. 5NK40-0174]|uniref:DUF1178 family protein n=1 Tax=Hydrogenophaga sp. 5NK40-0174 TaxID=3127649 RepID=UPI0031065B01
MKVLDLQCAHGHSFEGWFSSEDDYLQQKERGILTCPMCGEAEVRKMLSAPRLNLQKGDARETDSKGNAPAAGREGQEVALAVGGDQKALQARMLQALREVMANTEDVGERFAEEARAMHNGEVEQRSIRGQATPEETMELIEDGIDVVPLPGLSSTKETLQ